MMGELVSKVADGSTYKRQLQAPYRTAVKKHDQACLNAAALMSACQNMATTSDANVVKQLTSDSALPGLLATALTVFRQAEEVGFLLSPTSSASGSFLSQFPRGWKAPRLLSEHRATCSCC